MFACLRIVSGISGVARRQKVGGTNIFPEKWTAKKKKKEKKGHRGVKT